MLKYRFRGEEEDSDSSHDTDTEDILEIREIFGGYFSELDLGGSVCSFDSGHASSVLSGGQQRTRKRRNGTVD